MNVIGNAQITSPSGKEENCILFIIDDTTVPFLLTNVTEKEEDYVFSFWAKTNTSASLNIGEEEIVTSTDWKRYKVNFTAAEENIKIFFNNQQTYYLYRAQLEKGNVLTDWKPSPEDFKSELELKVNTEDLVSEINASANVIRLKGDRFVVDSTNLKISEDGTLKAVNGEFSGSIKSKSGEIGGFEIGEDVLLTKADKKAEIEVRFNTQGEEEGYVKIGNKEIYRQGGAIVVRDYDGVNQRYVNTIIGKSEVGGIKISTDELNDALYITPSGFVRPGDNSLYVNQYDLIECLKKSYEPSFAKAWLDSDYTLTKSNGKLNLIEDNCQGDKFQVVNGGIKILKDCVVVITASAYCTTGYNENDLPVVLVTVNESDNICVNSIRTTSASPYLHLPLHHITRLWEGDFLNLRARNNNGARGLIGANSNMTYLCVAEL